MDQVVLCKPGLHPEMPAVCHSGAVQRFQAVQPVFYRVVADLILIQIHTDGIGVTEHIDVLIFLKIHRHKLRLALRKFLRKFDALQHIGYNISTVFFIFHQFRKKVFPLLIILINGFEITGLLQPFLQSGKVVGHQGQYHRSSALLFFGQGQLL